MARPPYWYWSTVYRFVTRRFAGTMAGIHGTAHMAKPAAQSTKPHWLTRMGPMRITVAPEAKLAKMAPT